MSKEVTDLVASYVDAAVAICKAKGIDPNSPMAGEIFELIAKKSAPAK